MKACCKSISASRRGNTSALTTTTKRLELARTSPFPLANQVLQEKKSRSLAPGRLIALHPRLVILNEVEESLVFRRCLDFVRHDKNARESSKLHRRPVRRAAWWALLRQCRA